MSWIENLYQTYKNCKREIGNPHDRTPLNPICHTTQQAHIKIVINGDGNFLRASAIPKKLSTTITPCTEKSGSRSGKRPVSHPLFDKLQYIAGDFLEFGGEVTSGYAKNPKEPYENYIKDLSDWCSSPYRHPKVSAILTYLKKGRVIQDLVTHNVLYLGSNGKLLYEWKEEEEAPPIFKLLTGKMDAKGKRQAWQADAFAKFSVAIPSEPQADLESDSSVWESWTAYYSQLKREKNLCYVTGCEAPVATSHQSKIRNSGDKTKLISANDKSGFTFRGRFTDDDGSQACGVSFEVSEKAHNALRWLIARQGWRNGDLAFVAWAVSGTDTPDIMLNSLDLLKSESEVVEMSSKNPTGDTAQDAGRKIALLMRGYATKLGNTDKIVVMGLNSATGFTGRLAIIFYRELTGSEFLERLLNWHTQCAWFQRFNKEKIFFGAPAPKDIAKAAYGNDVDTKLCNATVERIIPCIIDGLSIPRDLVESTVRRACKRQSLEPWEWEKTLGIACSLYTYFHQREEYTMALDHERTTRDYLYGRLLAVADCLEGLALSDVEKGRPTNAARLMQRFADHPFSTWRTIELQLVPYKARLGEKGRKYEKALQEIMNLFMTDDYTQDGPLSGEFLIGFHTQRTELFKKSENTNTNTEEESEKEES